MADYMDTKDIAKKVTSANRSGGPAASAASIAISVCTRGRPERLRRCVESLLAMEIPTKVLPALIVVENDAKILTRGDIEGCRDTRAGEAHNDR